VRRLGELAHLWRRPAARRSYAYVLGLYLGDGYLARHPRTFRLEITLDAAYPGIVAECMSAVATLMPRNRVRTLCFRPVRSVDVTC
jgi:hypothetical protein